MGPRRLLPRGQGGGPVWEGVGSPFTGTVVDVIGAHVDGRIDITEPTVWFAAPEAVAAILASEIGWDWQAIRGPGPITWREAQFMLQIQAERSYGRPLRERLAMARAFEDSQAEALASEARRPN